MKSTLRLLLLITLATNAFAAKTWPQLTLRTNAVATDRIVGWRQSDTNPATSDSQWDLAVLWSDYFKVQADASYQPLTTKLTQLGGVSGTSVLYYLDSTGTPHTLAIGTGLTLNTSTHQLTSSAGGGNMNTTVYDQDGDGKVDSAALATHTHTASQISDSTAAGRSLLTAADAAAQKTLLGVNNVDNTSDANKPVSTAQATAIALKASLSALAATNGSGPNAVNGLVDWTQLKNVPAGFADGTDDGGGGSGVSQTSEVVASFSTTATTTLTRPAGSDFHTAFLTAGVGTGAYVRSVVLNTTNTPASGDEFRIVLALPASSNPSVEVYSGATGGTPMSVIKNLSATADTIALDYIYIGSAWVLASSNATRIKDLPQTFTYASPPADGKIEVDSATLGVGQMAVPMQADWNASSGNAQILNKPALIITSAGAGDSGKVPKLDSTGKLDSSVIPAGGGTNATQIQGVAVSSTAPTNGQVMGYNGTLWAPTAAGVGSGTYLNVASYYQMVDEFDGPADQDGNNNRVPNGWVLQQSGAAVNLTAIASTTRHPGIMRMSTANSGNSRIGIWRYGLGVDVGQGVMVFKCRIRLHTANEDGGSIMRFGLLNTVDGAATPDNSIYFEVNTSTRVAALKSAASGTTTTVASIQTMTLDTWYDFAITANAGGTSVQASVNGTNAGSAITTNIPAITGAPGFAARDNNGATSATSWDVDFVTISVAYTSSR